MLVSGCSWCVLTLTSPWPVNSFFALEVQLQPALFKAIACSPPGRADKSFSYVPQNLICPPIGHTWTCFA